MTYINKKGFKTQEVEFLLDGIKITKKSPLDYLEYEIAFDQISNKKQIRSTIQDGLLFGGVCFFLFSFILLLLSDSEVTVLLMGLGLFMIIMTFFRRVREVSIATYTGDDIKLYYTLKNKEQVVGLAEEIISSSNLYLLKKYSKIDRDIAIEPQLDNLQFLKNRDILSDEQFETLKNQLLGREHKSSIGFKS